MSRYQVVVWNLDTESVEAVLYETDRKGIAMQKSTSQSWLAWYSDKDVYRIALMDKETDEIWLHQRPGFIRKKLH